MHPPQLAHILRLWLLADMNDFAKMNALYGEVFSSNPPARSTVQVARLPRDVKVEIEVIALRSQ